MAGHRGHRRHQRGGTQSRVRPKGLPCQLPEVVPLPPPPAPLRRVFPAQRPADDRRLLLLTEVVLGPAGPWNHPQDPRLRAAPGRPPGARRRRRRGGRRLLRGRFSATMPQGPQRGLQRRDRAGPLGGQELCRLPAGALQLQGMLKRVDTVPHGPGNGRLGGCLVVVHLARWGRAAPVQASAEEVPGRDPPSPRLPGDRAWRLPGAGEAPRAQVAADRRGGHAADPGGLGNGQRRRVLGVVGAPVPFGSRFLVAHLQSLSRLGVQLRPRYLLAPKTPRGQM
jgi:hypothetical protein